jgi:secondary thiamine-phosphate synthase enzyme
MRQIRHLIRVRTAAQGMHEITPEVAEWTARKDFREGLLTLFIRHTSASLLIQENADPDVQYDLQVWLDAAAPQGAGLYRHGTEGPDDMPAHIKSALTQSHLSIPIGAGELMLGTWQGIYLLEHRRQPRDRQVILHFLGD